jgi:hypothetical protein
VDGSFNNLLPGRELYGAAQTPFARMLGAIYSNDADGDSMSLGNGAPPLTNTNYAGTGSVVDADPRTISNLIVDQTFANRAAVYAALKVLDVTGTAANVAVDTLTAAYSGALVEARAKTAQFAV